MSADAPVTLVIADDHPIFREGLKRLLEAEADLVVVGISGDVDETVRLVRERSPDVLLLDLAMPRRSGLDALRELAPGPDGVRVVILAAAIDDEQMVEALELGARGVILKEAATDLLLKCIRTVVTGQYWVGREAVAELVQGLRRARDRRMERAASRFGLTDRQIDIVKAIVSGATNREIGGTLGISEDTVKQHLSNIFDKCGVSTRVELALFAVDHHLVER